jgi:septal ring factor EnvC (AmiA/AmiB activator)
MVRASLLVAAAAAVLFAGLAVAQGRRDDGRALALAKRQAAEADLRSRQLEREAQTATDEAARARADASALAARIEASEADITAAETRVRIIERLRARQRARLAERQDPVVRLTAALQVMGRRPPALALVQPGSLHDLVHVRALLASTLPLVRARTAALRQEVEAGNQLRAQADRAMAALVGSREELKRRRIELASFEVEQRRRSQSLAESALFESDRALALGEEARELTTLMGTRQYQDQLRRELAALPGPVARPIAERATGREADGPRYRLPVEGRLLAGMGEISGGGVHARGLTFETSPNGPVVAPARGRVTYAGSFRSYGNIVIIDHGSGWTSVITNLGRMDVRPGDSVSAGHLLGRTSASEPKVTVELRHDGRPFAIAPLLTGG